MSDPVPEAAAWARSWLFDTALPLWAEAGVAPVGFHDRLDHAGRPAGAVLRLRVQARQTFVFAEAGRAGWAGPWRERVDHGARFLLGCTEDGRRLAPSRYRLDGTPEDGPADLYDQAFALLGFAAAFEALQDPRYEASALRLLEQLKAQLGRPDGGFEEGGPPRPPLRSNPHMHLFEAALAWVERSVDDRWRAMADALDHLARTRFIAADSGRLLENFQADWTPAAGDAGRVVEPGHQFEWAWLLLRNARLGGGSDLAAARHMAVQAREGGVDPERNVAINEQWLDGTPKDRRARLWPQTERLRTALALVELDGGESVGWRDEITAAVDGLRQFLDKPGPGLWRDSMDETGRFDDGPTSASSLYHIVGALLALASADRPGS